MQATRERQRQPQHGLLPTNETEAPAHLQLCQLARPQEDAGAAQLPAHQLGGKPDAAAHVRQLRTCEGRVEWEREAGCGGEVRTGAPGEQGRALQQRERQRPTSGSRRRHQPPATALPRPRGAHLRL